MTKRRQGVQVSRDQSFKGRQFTAEVILWAVRWYLMFPISYRDLELLLVDRGVEVDHTTIFRWIQAYAVELENVEEMITHGDAKAIAVASSGSGRTCA
jgi:IS6 family transposase